MKDCKGFAIIPGCLVRVAGRGRPWTGWVQAILEDSGLVGAVCERRGGGMRWTPCGNVTVQRPSMIQEARKIGNEKVQREVSEQAHRRAGLRRRI